MKVKGNTLLGNGDRQFLILFLYAPEGQIFGELQRSYYINSRNFLQNQVKNSFIKDNS